MTLLIISISFEMIGVLVAWRNRFFSSFINISLFYALAVGVLEFFLDFFYEVSFEGTTSQSHSNTYFLLVIF